MAKIVICDDHAISQLGIQCALLELFPSVGFQFFKASCGRDGIALVREYQPDYLILDLHLPDISGLEVLRSLREEGSSTKIMILTNEGNRHVLHQLLRYRATAILLKSYTLPMLEKAMTEVNHLASGQTYLDPSLADQLRLDGGGRQLSLREFEVLQLLIEGHTNNSIAEQLNCSPETIKTLRARIMEKTQTKNRAEITAWFQRGMVN